MPETLQKNSTLSVVLLHYPMTNRAGQTITTAVTNMDLHDISRTCRTFEVDYFFVVTPVSEQHVLIERILGHWKRGKSLEWHPDRAEALSRLVVLNDLAAVKDFLKAQGQWDIEVVMPDARPLPQQIGYGALRKAWAERAAQPVHRVIVFGTGWGIAPEFYPQVTHFLAPIHGRGGPKAYNHLSVRSAVAIVLDRLLSIL